MGFQIRGVDTRNNLKEELRYANSICNDLNTADLRTVHGRSEARDWTRELQAQLDYAQQQLDDLREFIEQEEDKHAAE